MAARGNEVEIVVKTKDQATGTGRKIARDMAAHGDKAGRGFSTRFGGGIRTGFGPIRGMVRGFGSSLIPLIAGAGLLAGGKAMRDLGIRITDLDKKARVVFEGQLPVVRRWADANKRAFGLSRRETVGLAANMADLLKPMGFTAREATNMSTRVLDLSGALSKWSGGTKTTAQVSESLTKALLGEREELKQLGISITEADVKARLAKKGQEDLTGAAREQAEAIATQELILEKSTDAQKAWADGGKAAAESQRSLGTTVAELKEALAAGLQPVIANIVGWLGTTLPAALENAKQWWDRNKDSVKLLAQTLQGIFVPAAKKSEDRIAGLNAKGVTLKATLSFLLEGVLRLALGWLQAEKFLNHLISGFASFITAGGHAINVVDRLSGGTGHAGDAMVAFGRDLKETARRELQAIQRDARNAQAAIDRMHGKTLHFTTVWTTLGRPGAAASLPGRPVGFQHGTQHAPGGLAIVGERGPELVDLPGGSKVIPNHQIGGAGRVVLEIHSGGSRLDDLLVEVLSKAVRVRGGNVQVVLGT